MTVDPRSIPLLTRPFYFVRHGETESNAGRTIAGSSDVLLTEIGRRQARAAALALEHCGITAVYSSALRRARDTADQIAGALGLPVTVIPELAERNWGDLEGKPRELRVPGVTPPGAETAEEFSRRIVKGLAKIDAAGIPLIVAHSGVFRVLCQLLGIVEPVTQIANAQPVRCIPPDPEYPAWRVETP